METQDQTEPTGPADGTRQNLTEPATRQNQTEPTATERQNQTEPTGPRYRTRQNQRGTKTDPERTATRQNQTEPTGSGDRTTQNQGGSETELESTDGETEPDRSKRETDPNRTNGATRQDQRNPTRNTNTAACVPWGDHEAICFGHMSWTGGGRLLGPLISGPSNPASSRNDRCLMGYRPPCQDRGATKYPITPSYLPVSPHRPAPVPPPPPMVPVGSTLVPCAFYEFLGSDVRAAHW